VAPVLFAQTGAPVSQQPQTPQPPAKSTALIIGRVVDGSTGQPVPEAVVTLTPPGGARGRGGPGVAMAGMAPEMQQAVQAAAAAAAAGGRGGPLQQRVMTGGDGRFVFHDLPPGQFQLTAALSGYTSNLSVTVGPAMLGGSAIASPASPTTMVLKEGEFATGVTLRLWKYAVVTGTVLDDAGEPAIGLTVQVARRLNAGGRVRYVPAWSARTDDRGAYRISSIVPGDYLVVVPQAQVSMPTAILSGLMDAVSGNSTGGGFALMDLMSSGVMPMEAMTGGVRLGDYMVASSGSVPLVGPDGRLLAYQTTFFPGSAVPAQASVVSLKSGDERSDLNFQLRLIPTSRISGVATGPDGPVANLGVRLVAPADGVVSESEFDVATAITKADGAFSFYGVPPGQFLLRAQKQPRPELPKEAMSNPALQMMFGPGGQPGAKDALFAQSPIAVANDDLDGIALRLTTGFRLSGRIEFESATGRGAPPPAQLQSITVNLTPVDGRMPNLLAMASPDRANQQGEFQTKGYESGRYFLTISGLGSWQPKSATVGGRDLLDAPVELRDTDLAGVVITMVDQLAPVTGTVTAPGETDLSETSVLLFPVDFRSWTENGMNPRRMRVVRASRAGAFSLPNVPVGEYFIIAVDRLNESDVQDPSRVDALSRVATRITVASTSQAVTLQKARVAK
jgi:hypothetical protein